MRGKGERAAGCAWKNRGEKRGEVRGGRKVKWAEVVARQKSQIKESKTLKRVVRGNTAKCEPERTSILSMSILPYCLRISLLAVFIASTVAIVLRKFSVVREACSMLNVCCWSCEIWPS